MVISRITETRNIKEKIESTPLPEANFSNPREKEAPKIEILSENVAEAKPIIVEHASPVAPSAPGLTVAYNADRDNNYRKIEYILEEDLEDVYFKMSPADQQKFKAKGEETTWAVLRLISKPTIKIKKLIDLIRGWLMSMTGLNKFFLEQTVKIKADKIMAEARGIKK